MAGAMKMNFFVFVIAATISRGARFYLVAYAAKIGGEKGMDAIVRNIDKIGYFIIALFFLYLLFKSWFEMLSKILIFIAVLLIVYFLISRLPKD